MPTNRLVAVGAFAACLFLAGCPNPVSSFFENLGLVPLPAIPGQAYGLAASPDGTQLAFTSADGLFVTDVQGGAARKLADSEGPITTLGWAADGKAVLFLPTTLPPPSQPGEPKRGPSPSYDYGHLQAVDLATGTISSSVAVSAAIRRILPCPDGHMLALMREDGLFLYDPQAGTTTQVTGQAWAPAIAWSPDGRSLAYVQPAQDRSTAIVVYDRTDGSSRRIEGAGITFDALGPESSCGYVEEKLAWTSDGTGIQVVQHRTASSFGVTTYGLDGQQRSDRSIEVGNPGGGYVDCYHPSPDGRYTLAYEIGRDSIPPPLVALVGVDLASGQVWRRSVKGGFVAWLGQTGHYLLHKSSSGGASYYVADVKG